jgi:dTDP-4-amino-4,6-dideoxygalactose transaminase
MIYYPVPLHIKMHIKVIMKAGRFSCYRMHYVNTVFSLPMHTELDQEEQLNYITDHVLEFVNKS